MTKEQLIESLKESGYAKRRETLEILRPVDSDESYLFEKELVSVYTRDFDEDQRVLVGDNVYLHERATEKYGQKVWEDHGVDSNIIFYYDAGAARIEKLKLEGKLSFWSLLFR